MTVAKFRDGMKVRLTKKFADAIDGVDLSDRNVGESFDVPSEQARLLLAERWAAPERRHRTESVLNGRRLDDPRLIEPQSSHRGSRHGSPDYRHIPLDALQEQQVPDREGLDGNG
jgi:hypothetical protein